MYSPRIKEEHVRKLYRLKQIRLKPMTVLVAEAVEEYLKNHNHLIKEYSHE